METFRLLLREQTVMRWAQFRPFLQQAATPSGRQFSSKALPRTPAQLVRLRKPKPSTFASRRGLTSNAQNINRFGSPIRQRPSRPNNTNVRTRRHQSTQKKAGQEETAEEVKPNVTSSLGSPESLSLSQRLRKLSREYGWSALGVYLGLSALDFPFCFLAVRMLGTERIGHWEHVIVDAVWNVISLPMEGMKIGMGKSNSQESRNEQSQEVAVMPKEGSDGHASPGDKSQEWSWGVDEAQEANQSEATIWTQLALAYAIHKSFIFIRVPLTAAVTPKVVKVLRGWGWNIGKRRPKAPKEPST